MDWFSRWPREALQAVAQHFLASYDLVCTPEVKHQVVCAMGLFQDGVAEASQDYFHRSVEDLFLLSANRRILLGLAQHKYM